MSCRRSAACPPSLGGPGRDHGHQPATGFLAEPAIAALIDDPLAALGTPEGAVTPVAVGIAHLGTFLTMIFGELVPKNLALAKPMEVARATQRFMRTFTAVNRIRSGC